MMMVEGESRSLLSHKTTEVLVCLLALLDIGKNVACFSRECRALELDARMRMRVVEVEAEADAVGTAEVDTGGGGRDGDTHCSGC